MPIEGWDAFMAATQELASASSGGGGVSGGGATGASGGEGSNFYDVPQDQGMGVRNVGSRANELYNQGWRPRPGDSHERLYAPGS